MRKLTGFLLPVSVLALGLPGMEAQAAGAAAAAQSDDEAIEEIVTTGLRGRPRSSIDSAVPIDTFDAEQINTVSHTDTQDILRTLIPSFNVSRSPIADGSTFIRNTELRGLPAHHTLVLINGKRRHRASLVAIGGSGRQGPDVATIPSAAIQSVEVLRDGASSQYGSDAIAGVINFNLKNNSEGFSLSADTGQFFEGDGSSTTIGGNVGLPLGSSGFLSISAEFNEADFSERSEQYCESFFCVSPTESRFGTVSNVLRRDFGLGQPTQPQAGVNFSDAELAFLNPFQQAYPSNFNSASVAGSVVQPWGQPNAESARIFYNAGIELGDQGTELYTFGNYSDSSGDGGFFYRFPDNSVIQTLRRPDGSFYTPLEIFPGGFTPRFEGEVEDLGFVAGLRGATDGGFNWDVSGRFGSNEIDYRLFNTINPSFGFTTPTDFRPGTLTNEELQFQVDLSNEWDLGGASPLVLAYGVSYLDEEYEVGVSSDPASYEAGPYAQSDPFGFCDAAGMPTTTAGTGAFSSYGGIDAVAGVDIPNLECGDSRDPAFTALAVGSNGFPGNSPQFSGVFARDSIAVYGDVSTDLTDSLFVQVAARFEDYSDFGNEFVSKIAARWLLNDNVALRGSFGTGFRAPTPGQQGTINVSTRLPDGVPVASGLFPPAGEVAQALGAPALDAETSTSFTIGLTAEVEDLTITVDYYSIDIDDRFNAITPLDVDPNADPMSQEFMNFLALQNAGVAGAASIGQVQYFTNAFDTETTGVDIVASYPVEWDNGQNTNVQFAYNWNQQKITSDASDFLNDEDQHGFENGRPNTRWNLSVNHAFNESFSVLVRGLYYGEYENSNSSPIPLDIQTFDSELFVDLEAGYQINDNWRVTVGGRNIFDDFPDANDRSIVGSDQCCGRIYDSGSVVPWQGGYYYGRVSVSF